MPSFATLRLECTNYTIHIHILTGNRPLFQNGQFGLFDFRQTQVFSYSEIKDKQLNANHMLSFTFRSNCVKTIADIVFCLDFNYTVVLYW